MTKRMIGAALWVVLLVVVGCGGSSRDSMTKEGIDLMNEISDILEKSANVAEAKPKLEAVTSRMKDLKKRMDTVGKPSAAEEEALKKKYEPEMQKAVGRLMGASMKMAMKDKEGAKDLQSIMTNMGP
jgi:hypothetical protein